MVGIFVQLSKKLPIDFLLKMNRQGCNYLVLYAGLESALILTFLSRSGIGRDVSKYIFCQCYYKLQCFCYQLLYIHQVILGCQLRFLAPVLPYMKHYSNEFSYGGITCFTFSKKDKALASDRYLLSADTLSPSIRIKIILNEHEVNKEKYFD